MSFARYHVFTVSTLDTPAFVSSQSDIGCVRSSDTNNPHFPGGSMRYILAPFVWFLQGLSRGMGEVARWAIRGFGRLLGRLIPWAALVIVGVWLVQNQPHLLSQLTQLAIVVIGLLIILWGPFRKSKKK